MVLGRYLLFGYFDPLGSLSSKLPTFGLERCFEFALRAGRSLRALSQEVKPWLSPRPSGFTKVPNYRVCRVSVLRIVLLVLGRS